MNLKENPKRGWGSWNRNCWKSWRKDALCAVIKRILWSRKMYCRRFWRLQLMHRQAVGDSHRSSLQLQIKPCEITLRIWTRRSWEMRMQIRSMEHRLLRWFWQMAARALGWKMVQTYFAIWCWQQKHVMFPVYGYTGKKKFLTVKKERSFWNSGIFRKT